MSCRPVVQPGDSLPPLTVVPTMESLARYAGASRDFSRIHYDQTHAHDRGLPGVIVHGLLKAAYLGRMLTLWLGERRHLVREFEVQYRRIDLPNHAIQCRAEVTSVRQIGSAFEVELRLWSETSEGVVTTQGRALVSVADVDT